MYRVVFIYRGTTGSINTLMKYGAVSPQTLQILFDKK